MSILSGLIGALVFSIVAVGLVEVIKGFLPETVGSKAKEVISLAVEVVVAVVGAILIKADGVAAVVLTAIGTVALSQLFYTNVVALIKKLTEFLKSKVAKSD